ncbi:hypothetical protein PILCRDRAFT_788176 [Piloderma croceum F 1598]|uniref:Uncharacterized protein n=1 Tax=Piloderma croceum (strain F 1598) TaxID=765440 RepID=A0A0C3F8E1_PILCF|nr:hypothetical protein PILCRDRAFT_788176 [Piloderma croceum F 1598]
MVPSPEDGPDASDTLLVCSSAGGLPCPTRRVLHAVRNRSVQHMEFLWVRWFGIVPGYNSGFKAGHLPKIGSVPETDELAFGFPDPSLVIRACHLIPAFADGTTTDLLNSTRTAARLPAETSDWISFYVSIYASKCFYFIVSFLMILAEDVGQLSRPRRIYAISWRRCRALQSSINIRL